MMSILEYAEDMNKTIKEIIDAAKTLGISASNEDDTLEQDDIAMLDNYFASDESDELTEEEELEDLVEEIIENEKIEVDNTVKKEKLKKKTDVSNTSKKDIAIKKKEMYKNKEKLVANAPITNEKVVLYKDSMTVTEFAKALNVNPAEIVKKLFMLGIMANVNNAINFENAELIATEYDKELKKEETADIANFEEFEIVDDEANLVSRPPVVTIMGHVDHGKTTLLDSIRNASVAEGEAGGITQAISAYQVEIDGKKITFIDTPGHAAFTEMRARGASITDIIIIIVAADDGVMPQTKEVIDHAKAANVPIIVAINKMDKPGANPDRIMTELSEYGLTPEVWGGETIYNKISAKSGDGVKELLESVLLIAEMEDLKANPNRYASGTVIEARLDKHVGPIVTLLIGNGTLRLGDPVCVGTACGKVRILKDDKGKEITEALPSQPVEITGLDFTPTAGDKFMSFELEKEAKAIALKRREAKKEREAKPKEAATLEDLFAKIKEGQKEINVILKADVNGSVEAVKNALEKIDVEGVKVNVIRAAVGAITDGDIVLAKSSGAIIIAFNIRPNTEIKDRAEESGVEIRLYNIIYKAVEEMESAMKGMLDPEYEEKVTGTAEVRQLFKFSKVGTIAGCYVTDGIIKSNSNARIIRDSVVLYDGKIDTIQREKDQVKEVKKGFECGITIENFNDLKERDIIEAYEMVEIKR